MHTKGSYNFNSFSQACVFASNRYATRTRFATEKYWERILALSLEIHLLFDVLHRSFYLLQTTEALNKAAAVEPYFATNYTHFRAQDAGRRGKKCGALVCRGIG